MSQLFERKVLKLIFAVCDVIKGQIGGFENHVQFANYMHNNGNTSKNHFDHAVRVVQFAISLC